MFQNETIPQSYDKYILARTYYHSRCCYHFEIFWAQKRTWCWKGLCNKEVGHDQRCLGVQGRRSIFYLEHSRTMCCCMPIGPIQNPKSIHHRTMTGCIGLLQHTAFWHRHFSWLASNGSCTLTSIQCIGDTSTYSEELSSHDLTRVTPPKEAGDCAHGHCPQQEYIWTCSEFANFLQHQRDWHLNCGSG